MKILINFTDWNYNVERRLKNTYGGVGYYRLIKPSQFIKGHDVTIWGQEIKKAGKTLEKQWENVFTDFDVYWTNYFCDDIAASAIFYMRDKLKKKVIIDIDDNYLDIPLSNPLYHRFKSGKKDRAFMSTILSFADVITVSTEPLKQRVYDHMKTIYGLNKKIVVIPNYNDIKDWDYPPAPKKGDKIVIGYSGSNSHYDDLIMVMPSIAAIMKKYPQVYFQCLGAMEKRDIPFYFKGFTDEMLNRCEIVTSTMTFNEYPKWFSKQQWDIGIAPLVDTAFTRCKSSIKWLEYSTMKIPTIASRVYPYFMDVKGKDTIDDGHTGLLCKPHEWFDALEKLVLDKKMREWMGQNAYDAIKKNWQYKDTDIEAVIEEVLK